MRGCDLSYSSLLLFFLLEPHPVTPPLYTPLTPGQLTSGDFLPARVKRLLAVTALGLLNTSGRWPVIQNPHY